jgi:hypothetical protein
LKYSGIEKIKYIDIDIPAVSYVAWHYLNCIYGSKLNTISSMLSEDIISIENLNECTVLNNWQIERVKGNIDLFVNFISFQEMEPEIVANYLGHVNRLKATWILLREIREGKQVKMTEDGVGVKTPILTNDYIEMLKENYVLIDEDVDIFGYRTADNFHSELLLFRRK